jgi:hypothetical protein
MKHKAIYELYPNVKRIDENNDGIFTVYDADKNVVNIDMTLVETKSNELENELDAKIQAEKDAQVSGNQKLLDLGLTQAEATALTGYTPPVE